MSWIERVRERRTLRRKHLLGAANYLTYARIATIPLFVWLIPYLPVQGVAPNKWQLLLNFFLVVFFIVTGVTDVIDGYLARRGESSGNFGKFLDPLADKLVTSTVLIMLVPLGRVPAWIAVVLILRELTITALRGMAASEDIVIAASDWGKRKSLMEHFALSGILIHYSLFGLNFQRMGLTLLLVTVLIALGSAAHYIWCFFSEILERHKQT